MAFASLAQRAVKSLGVGIALVATPVEHRRQIRAAAKPLLGRDDETRVHMHSRDIRIARMGDQRNPRGPKARIGRRALNLAGKFGSESSKNLRDMHARFLEDASAQRRHASAPAGLAGMVDARPGFDRESARRLRVRREGAGASSSSFSRAAMIFSLQVFEPGAGGALARF